MRTIALTWCWCMFTAGAVIGQVAVGHTTWLLVDEGRNNREISCEVWYPALSAGEEVDPEGSNFSSVVFAHGFVMSPMDYELLAAGWVEAGFVVVGIGTEQGFAPNHESLALDLNFVSNEIVEAQTSGILEGTLNARVAIAGHSMGGGTAWLAAGLGTVADALIALAPAETNPSAIAAGEEIDIPVLVMSGSADVVTPPETQHIPIYESGVNASCRAFVSITNGGHCGFADQGTLCDIGELGFSGMTHAAQRERTLAITNAWLAHHLNEDPEGLNALEVAADQYDDLALELICELQIREETGLFVNVYPNPSNGLVYIENETTETCVVSVLNSAGELIKRIDKLSAQSTTTTNLPRGFYAVIVINHSGNRVVKKLVCR
ncbi:MAG: T9SS type A sorting domain-containing protein [Bacteroidetes bacterium]|nr:T9SS type A sorting domain-containing protein [Bacteroidota bacterium]